jgi:hypothetical protein
MDALGNNSQPQQAVAPPEETEAAGGDGNGIGGRQPRLSMSQRTVPGVNYVGGRLPNCRRAEPRPKFDKIGKERSAELRWMALAAALRVTRS